MGGLSPQPGNSTVVSGIGREAAAAIAYRNLTTYLVSTSDYQDARLGSILAAIDLFGPCSNEVVQTIKAWDAVNVLGDGTFDLNINTACNIADDLYDDYFYAVDELRSSCDFSADADYKVFTAGDEIILQDGFISNGNMLLYINDCLSGISGKTDEYPSYGGAGAATPIQIAPEPPNGTHPNLRITKIFPNPTTGHITLQAPEAVATVQVLELTGRVLQTLAANGSTTVSIDLSAYQPGTYLLRAVYTSGKAEVWRVVRQ